MRWGQRFDNEDEVPEELRGKSPKEVAEALRKSKETEDRATAAEAAAEAEASTHKTQLQQMRERMTQLEANQRPVEEPVVEEPPSPWVDPQKFVQDQTKGVATIAMNAGLMTAKMYFMQNITPRDTKIFKKYEREVEATVSTFAPEARVMPQSWLNAFMYVKGLHEVEIAKAESDKSDFFSEVASRSQTEDAPREDVLTPEETELCKTMHWDAAGYLKRKKDGVIAASSKGQYARFRV